VNAPLPLKHISEAVSEFTQGDITLDETIKIISLLENPVEAASVRKALRFYELPKRLQDFHNYKWSESEKSMEILFHFDCPQNKVELNWMLERIRSLRVCSLLEVGSSFGGTLKRMASVMPKGSKIVSVDLPCDSTPKFLNPLASLKDTCFKLGRLGANIELFIGDSHDSEVVESVRAHGPFDFCFIDGDHSYEGVKADWENYGPMCKVVGFHDIAGPVLGCTRFWRELKNDGKYRTEECISYEERKFGIGLLFREEGA
jgi:hypothetical protein